MAAAHLRKGMELLLGFHAFRDHIHSEGVRHTDHGLQDRPAPLPVPDLAQEAHVDLQHVRLYILQEAE